MLDSAITSTLFLTNHCFTYLLNFSGKSFNIRGERSNSLISKSERLSRNSLASSIPLNPAPTIATLDPCGNPQSFSNVIRDFAIV